MDTLNILVVEDDSTAFNGYTDEASDLSNNDLTINLSRALSAKEAIEKLTSEDFHGAIIDLNLLGDTHPEDTSGVGVVSKIHESFRIPIVVVSGNIQNLPAPFDSGDNRFIKKFDRTASNNVIFQEILNIFNTGILEVIGGTGLIEEGLNTVFWNHLSKDIDEWFQADENVKRSLLRYTLNHLAAYLDKPEDNSKNTYHKAEFYLKQPVKETIAPGDILFCEDTNERLILLSPACDVEIRNSEVDGQETINAKSLILARISDSDPKSLVDNGLSKSAGKDSTVGFLSKVVKGTELKCAFLPQYKELKEGIIDFQNLVTVNFEKYKEFNRLATVSESFFKDIQSRFSSYYARQGTPDLNKESIIESYKAQHFPPAP